MSKKVASYTLIYIFSIINILLVAITLLFEALVINALASENPAETIFGGILGLVMVGLFGIVSIIVSFFQMGYFKKSLTDLKDNDRKILALISTILSIIFFVAFLVAIVIFVIKIIIK